ncbi:hypothetical protein [Streptomyces sp. B1I3]|uniref:hypothetical protein n=1 Tax=Streptomyces sp. B1I3 TaxID=3042264 RepID=UPI0027892908|nr:hypothetical protein [Streptomyces sp. B1I3]MDQ0795568.1 hypothetical protein [Streptomyces sp. B1I3]
MAATALPATAIVQAETYYLPPPPRRGQIPQDWSQVPGAELVYKWVEYRMGRRVPVPTGWVPDHPGLYARIDDGRWLVECDACQSAWIVSVLDPRFGCAECKQAWVPLIVPEDIAAAEAEALALERRWWWHPDDPLNPVQPPEPEPGTEPEEPQP